MKIALVVFPHKMIKKKYHQACNELIISFLCVTLG